MVNGNWQVGRLASFYLPTIIMNVIIKVINIITQQYGTCKREDYILGVFNMSRMAQRYWIRKQNVLLIRALRVSYGLAVIVLMLVNINIPGTIMQRVYENSSFLGKGLTCFLAFSSVLLVLDVFVETVWNNTKEWLEKKCKNCHIKIQRFDKLNTVVRTWCAFATRYRHWFYLPTTFGSLFTIPLAAHLNIPSSPILKIFYLWLFLWGMSCALLEGAINNGKLENA